MSAPTTETNYNLPPRPRLSPSSSSSAPSLAKPPTSIDASAHLDPSAYVLGTHPISLSPGVLIHPRARLISTHGPLILDAGTIVSERCIVGAPAPDPKADPSAISMREEGDEDEDPLKTFIGSNCIIYPSAEIMAGAVIGEGCIVEAHATIKKSITIGARSKICAGVTVDRDVGDWEVVWGDGQMRRKRVRDERYENGRLKALARDREGTMGTLRLAAQKALVGKRKG